MQFDHHNMTGVHLAVSLVNLKGPWDVAVVEKLLQDHWIRNTQVSEAVLGDFLGLAGR